MNSNLNELTTKLGLSLDNTIDFRAVLASFWEYRRLIIIITLLAVFLSSTYTYFKAPQYESNVLLQVDAKSHMGANMGAMTQLMGPGGEINPTATQKELIRSRVILEPVVKQLGLDLSLAPHPISFLKRLFSRPNANIIKLAYFNTPTAYYNKPLLLTITDATHFNLSDQSQHVLIQGEINKLSTSPDHLFAIEVTGQIKTPSVQYDVVKYSAYAIANGLRSQLHIDELGADGTPTGLLQVSMLGTDPLQVTAILNTIASVAANTNSISKSQELSQTIDFLNHQIPLAKDSLAEAENTLNVYRAKSGKIDISFESRLLLSQLATIERQIVQIKVFRADALQRFTPINPYILQLSEKINQLYREKVDIESQLKKLPASDQIAINMMRDVKAKNTIYLVLLNKIQELRVEKAGAASDLHVLATANMPDTAVSKQTSIIVTASFFLGLILSCIIVIARKSLFHRVSDPQWIEQHFQIANLAIIPYSAHQTVNMELFKQKAGTNLQVLAAKSPADLSIEALRSLRTNLQLMLCETTNNIITILGISPGIGKSFVSINFSYLLADIGKRVLLIDGDIRKGCLNKYLNVPRGPGLSEVLSGDATLEKSIQTIFPNLNFISCGNFPQNPSELLTSHAFKNLLNSLSSQYDIILIDTAPVLAVTDSTIIAGQAGINFLVIGSDVHTTDEITTAVKRAKAAGIKINGTIFNNLKKSTVTQGNYHYHYREEIS